MTRLPSEFAIEARLITNGAGIAKEELAHRYTEQIWLPRHMQFPNVATARMYDEFFRGILPAHPSLVEEAVRNDGGIVSATTFE